MSYAFLVGKEFAVEETVYVVAEVDHVGGRPIVRARRTDDESLPARDFPAQLVLEYLADEEIQLFDTCFTRTRSSTSV